MVVLLEERIEVHPVLAQDVRERPGLRAQQIGVADGHERGRKALVTCGGTAVVEVKKVLAR